MKSDFNRYDDDVNESSEERDSFLNFLNAMAMLGAAKKEGNSNNYMAKFFYDKYQAFVNAGFSEDQAFELLLTIIGGAAKMND